MSDGSTKLSEAKFLVQFIVKEIDKAIELAGENKVVKLQLKKIKELLK